VYIALSALDFPFCYILVKTLGTEKIGEWEHATIGYIRKVIPWQSKEMVPEGPAVEAEDAEKAKGLDAKEADNGQMEGASMCRVPGAMMPRRPNGHADDN
jgi:hypothetical protein